MYDKSLSSVTKFIFLEVYLVSFSSFILEADKKPIFFNTNSRCYANKRYDHLISSAHNLTKRNNKKLFMLSSQLNPP